MNFESIDESKLNTLIMMEEFKLWDAKRNKVPDHILEEIKRKILKLKEAKAEKLHHKSN